MKKPAWIRFFGWAFLFLFGMFLSYWFLRREPEFTPTAALGAYICLLLSFPCLFLWVIGSIVYAFQKRGAELRAAAVAEGMRRAGVGSGLASDGARESAVPPGAIPVRGSQMSQKPPAALQCKSITNPNAERVLSGVELEDKGRAPGWRVMTSPLGVTASNNLRRRNLAELPQPPRSEPPSPSVYTYEAPGQALCPQCGVRPALFYCRSHQSPLCLSCVGSHDVPANCVYVPGWRTEAAFTGQPQAPGATYTYEAPGLPLCPQCSIRPALFYCRTHRLVLCLGCIGAHDIPADCSYDPSWRAGEPDARPSQRGRPSRPTQRKTGDVFGIS